jgi:hypothetical protein
VDFEEFIQTVRDRTERALDPSMTVERMADTLSKIKKGAIEDAGGSAAMFVRYPKLLGIPLAPGVRTGIDTVGDALAVAADAALRHHLDPVAHRLLWAHFEDHVPGTLADVLAYAVDTQRHLPGAFPGNAIETINEFLDTCRGEFDSVHAVWAVDAAARSLKLATSAIRHSSKWIEAIGGEAKLLHHADLAQKLLVLARDDEARYCGCIEAGVDAFRRMSATARQNGP